MRELATKLVETLPVGLPLMFNPWKERCPHDTAINGPEARFERLVQHLECDAKLILCGEAPGFRGCRYSGIAFTSERLLEQGVIPRMERLSGRLSDCRLSFTEPSATVVWKHLFRLGMAEHTVLWNAVQLHPFKNDENILSNRTPSNAEVEIGIPAMQILATAYPNAKVVAVGQKAGKLLRDAGIPIIGDVRHPANGGATLFANQLQAILENEANK